MRTGRAALALVLYVLGALVLPALHLAWHVRPHQHVAQGLRLHPQGAAELAHVETAAEHRHDDAAEVTASASGPGLRRGGGERPPLDAGHGLGSLSHFALGWLAASTALRLAHGLCAVPVAIAAARRAEPLARVGVAAHGPRGPPGALSFQV